VPKLIVMDQVSRPLLGLLAAAVAVFALYFLALKPGSSTSGGSAATGQSPAALSSAVNKARGAVAASNAASVAHGGTIPATSSATTAPSTTVQSGPSSTHLKLATSPKSRLDSVQKALKAKQTLALLFYNPLAADDRAVKGELASVPVHGGKVFKLAIPVSELSRYPVVTQQVPITSTPTLVLINPNQQASTIVGFSDRFEIAQRVADALHVP
jgi:hypothetical protein